MIKGTNVAKYKERSPRTLQASPGGKGCGTAEGLRPAVTGSAECAAAAPPHCSQCSRLHLQTRATRQLQAQGAHRRPRRRSRGRGGAVQIPPDETENVQESTGPALQIKPLASLAPRAWAGAATQSQWGLLSCPGMAGLAPAPPAPGAASGAARQRPARCPRQPPAGRSGAAAPAAAAAVPSPAAASLLVRTPAALQGASAAGKGQQCR